MTCKFGNIEIKTLAILLAMFVIAVIFWDTLLIYPIKLFVVILHESSHGLAAVVMGGRILSIEINQRIGGVCYVLIPQTFAAQFVLSSAGYLGSILWGGLILIFAARTKYDNILGVIIGGFLILLSVLYIRTVFGALFTIGFGLLLAVVSFLAKNVIVDLLMKFLGMTSCLYVIIDIKHDLIDRTNIGSDADSLAQLLGAQNLSMVIGIIWIIIAVFAFGLFLWISGRGKNRNEKRPHPIRTSV